MVTRDPLHLMKMCMKMRFNNVWNFKVTEVCVGLLYVCITVLESLELDSKKYHLLDFVTIQFSSPQNQLALQWAALNPDSLVCYLYYTVSQKSIPDTV